MEARLKRLERLNRILFVGLALALVPWVVGAATNVADLLEAKSGKFQAVGATSFDLTDDAGNKVGGLVGKKDASNLIIRDSNGKIRIFLGIMKGHPSLLFGDKQGQVVASYAEKDGMFETTN